MDVWNEYIQRNQVVINPAGMENRLMHLVDKLVQITQEKSTIVFTAGNGGSATTADHFAADLALTNKRVGYPLRAICLNSHLGLTTALSNDIRYSEALSEQLKNYAFEKHIVITFSASGNSNNLISLHKTASIMGLEAWAFLGFDGGEISNLKDIHTLVFPDEKKNYGILENANLTACHFIVEQLNARLVTLK